MWINRGGEILEKPSPSRSGGVERDGDENPVPDVSGTLFELPVLEGEPPKRPPRSPWGLFQTEDEHDKGMNSKTKKTGRTTALIILFIFFQ
jgi:hypothetical protein